MPISIAGSGTITGISAGGLPDDCITTADIAAGAVTDAKVNASAAIADSKLSGTTCKAWVNFNGTSTVAIRASYNVRSITDNGTGDYTVNFTTALADANYASCITGGGDGAGSGSFPRTSELYSAAFPKTSSACRLWTKQASGSPGTEDSPYVNVAIFR